MNSKCFVASFVVCSFLACDAISAPSVLVSSSYNQAGGYIEWEVAIAKNAPTYTGALAVELPMTLSAISPGFSVALRPGSDLLNAGPNQTWYYNETSAGSGILLWNTSDPPNPNDHLQNVGLNPFTMTVTEGLVNLPNPVPTLHIASADGKIQWLNAIVAEDGVQYGNISGMATSILLGDMNGNGMTSVLDDLDEFTLALGTPAAYQSMFPGLDYQARGDINQDGSFNTVDLAAFVPEPGSLSLICVACAAMGFVRRRQSMLRT
jgi:hypothetical protein